MDRALKRKKFQTIAVVVVVLCALTTTAYLVWSKGESKFFLLATNPSITIQIKPFDDLSTEKANYVLKEIKKIYSNTVLLKSVKLPAQAFYKPRGRYRADTLIAWLSRRTPENAVTIGLTSKDVSTNKEKIVDWGVMGLGYCPGNACVVSTFRLKKTNLLDQLFKVAIHELGHTQGLPHCEVKSCFMRDAEGHNTADEEFEFCPKCKKVLAGKGWVFK
jgi:archaemetzincin